MKKNIIWYTVLLSVYFCSAAFAEEAPQAWKYYNQGVDSYNKLDYNKAVENFQQALNTEDKQLEQWSNYNIAGAYFRQAQKLESGDQEQALRDYENSRQFFRRAIELNPRDKDAKYNYEVTLRKIEELKKKQKQDKQEQKQQKQEQPEKQPQGQQKPEDKPQDKNAAEEKPTEAAAGQSEEKKDAGAETQAGSRREMSKEEALMLLENFQQAEKAQDKLLLQDKQRQSEQESGKDW